MMVSFCYSLRALLLQRLQRSQEEVVELRYSRDVHSLIWRVRILDGRAKGYHVHTRIIAANDTTLQTCMDDDHAWLYAIVGLVGSLHDI